MLPTVQTHHLSPFPPIYRILPNMERFDTAFSMTNPKTYVHFFVDVILVNIFRISKPPPPPRPGEERRGLTGAGGLAAVFRHLGEMVSIWSKKGL